MSFDGDWTLLINTPMGKQEVDLKILDRGGVISGAATQGAEAVPLLEPTVEGDRIRWTQHVTKPMKLTIKFDLRRDGDALSGTAKAGIFPASAVTGQRKS